MSFETPRALSKKTGEALAALARVVRARRIYHSGSDALNRMIDDCVHTFTELLNQEPHVSIRVRPHAFHLEGTVVLEDQDPEQSIPFTLFRDGIRRLDFSLGITKRELEVFSSATAHGLLYSGLGDDVVSFLWKHDLEHIRYLVVDTIVVSAQQLSAAQEGREGAADQTSVPDVDAQINGLLRSIYGDSSTDDGPQSVHIDATDIPAKAIADGLAAPDEMAPGFHPLASLSRPKYAQRFSAEVALENEDALMIRGLDAAMRGLGAVRDERARLKIQEWLIRVFDTALVNNEVPIAARIVQVATEVANGGLLLEEVTAEPRLRQVAGLYRENPTLIESFVQIFRAAGRRAVPIVLDLLPGFEVADQRRILCDLALELGVDDLPLLSKMLDHEHAFAIEGAVYVLCRMPNVAARDILSDARSNDRSDVRRAIIRQVELLPAAMLQDIAIALLSDPDPTVQAGAARALSTQKNRQAADAISALVSRTDLKNAPTMVKQALLECHAQLNQGRAIKVLEDAIKNGAGLLSTKEGRELAFAAINALGLIPSQRTLQILEKVTSSRHKQLKDAAQQVITRLKSTSR